MVLIISVSNNTGPACDEEKGFKLNLAKFITYEGPFHAKQLN
jgi:hypothetical protein